MIRHEGPGSSPVEGVLVERKLDGSFDLRNAKRCIEFTEGGGEPTQICPVSGERHIDISRDVWRSTQFRRETSYDDITNTVPFENLEEFVWPIRNALRHCR